MEAKWSWIEDWQNLGGVLEAHSRRYSNGVVTHECFVRRSGPNEHFEYVATNAWGATVSRKGIFDAALAMDFCEARVERTWECK